MTNSTEPDISTIISGIRFKNPFYVSSGPTTKSVKQLKRIEELGWAAASIKLTIDPAPYINRLPRYAVFNDRNALCFTAEKRLKPDEGLLLVNEAKEALKSLIIMANITYAGDGGVTGWVNLAKRFEEAGADIIELNMCCPNMSYNLEISSGGDKSCSFRTGASLGQDAGAVAEIVREIKSNVRIPVFVKLTPEGGKIAQIASAAYHAGADAVGGTANRLGIPPIDLDDPGASPYHLQEEISMSCHAGGWVKPLALRDTFEIRKANGPDFRIMATGGVSTYRDAVEMIMCGADIVGICAETLISGFGIISGLENGLKSYMREHGYTNLAMMRDLVVPSVRSAADLTLHKGYARIRDANLAAPCKAACPIHMPVQGFVRMAAKGEFRRAYELIMSGFPLQSVCASVCRAECESGCTRNIGDGKKSSDRPVRIREIKKFILEYSRNEGWGDTFTNGSLKSGASLSDTGSKPPAPYVAVVGSGPAGLTCAYNLAQKGYKVTVFEKERQPGGMLRYGLPSFRLDRRMLDEEIERIRTAGVEIRTGVEVCRSDAADRPGTVSLTGCDGIKIGEFAAVFIATGAMKSRNLDVPGEEEAGLANRLIDSFKFLKSISENTIESNAFNGKRVVVAGGGYTAVDAARSALRLGAAEVIIAYRRTRSEMPVSEEELRISEAEGVKILYLMNPVEVISENDSKISGIKFAVQTLGEEDSTGRRSPEIIYGAEFTLPCDIIISAAGQMPGTAFNTETGDAVFIGGDAAGAGTIASAMADGFRAAYAIGGYLDKRGNGKWPDSIGSVRKEHVLCRVGYCPEVVSDENRDTFSREPLSEEEAVKEAQRCLSCGCGEGCGICAEICSEFAVKLQENDIWNIDGDECVACGMCFNRCPNGNIEMADLGRV